MSTRSYIGVKRPDYKIDYVYCHFDGYLEGVGQTLKEHYADGDLTEVFKHGDMSYLGETPAESGFYDEGETSATKTAESLYEYKKRIESSWVDYGYLFQDGKWYYTTWDADGNTLLLWDEV